jgi:hypothetical protein
MFEHDLELTHHVARSGFMTAHASVGIQPEQAWIMAHRLSKSRHGKVLLLLWPSSALLARAAQDKVYVSSNFSTGS